MADMRLPVLWRGMVIRILSARCRADAYPPRNHRYAALFPSGRCCRPPRRQSLKPGPFVGPGFLSGIDRNMVSSLAATPAACSAHRRRAYGRRRNRCCDSVMAVPHIRAATTPPHV